MSTMAKLYPKLQSTINLENKLITQLNTRVVNDSSQSKKRPETLKMSGESYLVA